jgi:hypothetical protein
MSMMERPALLAVASISLKIDRIEIHALPQRRPAISPCFHRQAQALCQYEKTPIF